MNHGFALHRAAWATVIRAIGPLASLPNEKNLAAMLRRSCPPQCYLPSEVLEGVTEKKKIIPSAARYMTGGYAPVRP